MRVFSLLFAVLLACALVWACAADDDSAESTDDDTADDDTDDDDAADDDTADDDDDDDQAGPDELKVMTFNLRLGVADDGENSWPKRKQIVADMLNQEQPDLLGTQEGWKFQLDYIKASVPGYEWVGISRRGGVLDEYSALFYRTEKFTLLDSGTFWLSDTPETPGSVFSQDQLCPRIVTWAELELLGSGRRLFAFNTHFDTYNGDDVPQRSAALLVRRIELYAPDAPVVVTGDFNEYVGSEAYRILTGEMDYNGASGELLDPWVELDLPEEGSLHGFTGVPTADSRIDWVLSTEDFLPLSGVVLHYNQDGRYPSDHFPVYAEFELP